MSIETVIGGYAAAKNFLNMTIRDVISSKGSAESVKQLEMANAMFTANSEMLAAHAIPENLHYCRYVTRLETPVVAGSVLIRAIACGSTDSIVNGMCACCRAKSAERKPEKQERKYTKYDNKEDRGARKQPRNQTVERVERVDGVKPWERSAGARGGRGGRGGNTSVCRDVGVVSSGSQNLAAASGVSYDEEW